VTSAGYGRVAVKYSPGQASLGELATTGRKSCGIAYHQAALDEQAVLDEQALLDAQAVLDAQALLDTQALLDEQAPRQEISGVHSSYDSSATTPPPKREPFVGYVTLEPRQERRC